MEHTNAEGMEFEKVAAGMIEHGARRVETHDLFREGTLVWHLPEGTSLSQISLRLEELMTSAARNCKRALDVIARIDSLLPGQDPDLPTALKKYVEDTCEAIKVVDNDLATRGSGLAELLVEFPSKSNRDEMTWRNLIGRRDVIVHQILTVEDRRVYAETKRDFHNLYQLLSRVFFVPAKTDIEKGTGFAPMIKTDLFDGLTRTKKGSSPRIGESLTFVCDDQSLGFISLRLGITDSRELLVATSKPLTMSMSVYAM